MIGVRDRDGSLIGEDTPDPAGASHRCRRGWLAPPEDDDVPRPCPICRRWLTERPARPPTRAELDELAARLTGARS